MGREGLRTSEVSEGTILWIALGFQKEREKSRNPRRKRKSVKISSGDVVNIYCVQLQS